VIVVPIDFACPDVHTAALVGIVTNGTLLAVAGTCDMSWL